MELRSNVEIVFLAEIQIAHLNQYYSISICTLSASIDSKTHFSILLLKERVSNRENWNTEKRTAEHQIEMERIKMANNSSQVCKFTILLIAFRQAGETKQKTHIRNMARAILFKRANSESPYKRRYTIRAFVYCVGSFIRAYMFQFICQSLLRWTTFIPKQFNNGHRHSHIIAYIQKPSQQPRFNAIYNEREIMDNNQPNCDGKNKSRTRQRIIKKGHSK